MRIETLLNHCYKLKSFVYSKVEFGKIGGRLSLIADITPRANGIALCSVCGRRAPLYDHLDQRLFSFVPLWNIPVYFRYRMRRINCPEHSVRVEKIPWADGKSHITKPFQLFLARWARKLSWKETAEAFHATWDDVYRSIKGVVEYGMMHRSMDGITAIGVDEIAYRGGHKYLTLVYQIDASMRRLLFVGRDRKVKTLLRFFMILGKVRSAKLRFVCSDMWRPYIKVIKKKAVNALNILDRFHIIQHLNRTLDKIRATEVREMKRKGLDSEVLKNTKFCLLKNEANLTDKQRIKLKDVLQYDLKSVRAYLLKESFQLFWSYTSPYWAEWYLDKWCKRAIRSRLEPIKAFVKTIRNHQPLIMNWFKAKKQYSSGVVEGLNRKINLVTRKAFGYRSYETLKIALYHTMGELPEPKSTHKFC